jgi:ParB family chromosome partitioning protein
LVKNLKAKKGKKKRSKHASSEDIYFQSISDDLTRLFGTKVRIVRRGKAGRLEIEFYGNDDLGRLVDRLKALT